MAEGMIVWLVETADEPNYKCCGASARPGRL